MRRSPERDVDVVIVGGGPAGLATALFLCHSDPGRRGRVVVLEKERYPRDKYCAGGIGARADQLLARIGVTVDVPSVIIDNMSLDLAGGRVAAADRGIGRVVRRIEFDHELARIAERNGAIVRDGARVTGFHVESDGVIVESTAGNFRAQVLVGADGVGSFVRRALGLPAGSLRAQVIELDTEAVPGDPDRRTLHFDASQHALTGYAWDFPTIVDGRPLVCRGVYQLKIGSDDPSSHRAASGSSRTRAPGRGGAEGPPGAPPHAAETRGIDVHDVLRARLAERGLDIARYRIKRYAERGFELHVPYASRRVLLVGEAAGIDGLTGEGIAQAIAYGAFAGPYLAEKLERRDFAFHDFTDRVTRSPLGFELRVRGRTIPYYFGKHRALIERFVLCTPDFFAMGVEHFAGRRLSRARLAKSALGFGAQLLSGDRARRATRVRTEPEPV
jgi:flavin-dependent dehydrogenase